MPEQPTGEVRGGLDDVEVTVQQPDIDTAVARATARATEKLRVGSRRPLNAGAQTVAFSKKRTAAKGAAEVGGVKVTVSITVLDAKDRGEDEDIRDEVSYIDDTGSPSSAPKADFEKESKAGRVQGAAESKSRKDA